MARTRLQGVVGMLVGVFLTGNGYADPMDGTDGMFVMGAIGDSITTGFNANLPLDNKSLSWSTGYAKSRKVQSHYWRAKDTYPGEVYQINSAVAGARSDGLAKQMANMTKDLKGRELDYLTVMIGANDVCSWPQEHNGHLERFDANVRGALQSAMDLNPNIKITLVPVPNMLRLYEMGQEKGCSLKWRMFKLCAPLLLNDNADERAAFGNRVEDLNQSLANMAADFPGNIRYAADVATFDFEQEDISGYDCFHPSWRGQQKIADYSWMDGWYQ